APEHTTTWRGLIVDRVEAAAAVHVVGATLALDQVAAAVASDQRVVAVPTQQVGPHRHAAGDRHLVVVCAEVDQYARHAARRALDVPAAHPRAPRARRDDRAGLDHL